MFKKGDVVEVVESKDYWSIKVGEKYTLTDDQSGEMVYIGAPAYQPYKAKRFKLVSGSPVRTVTRQEIIPGTYDGVRVGPPGEGAKTVPVDMVWGYYTADSLTRAAAVLTALAGALRDGR